MAKKTPETRSLSVSNELYERVQAVREVMQEAGPCKTCGHEPGKIPLKQASEKIVRLGLEQWGAKQTQKEE